MSIRNISEEYIIHQRMEIGRRLKEIREARGLSIKELADQSNIDRTTISKIEAGMWNFGINILIMYAKFLGFEIKFNLVELA